MEGKIKVSYTIMCKNDVKLEVGIAELLANEKVNKAIKSEFAKGLRNLELLGTGEGGISIKTEKETYEMIVDKDDFADILVLAEEDAQKNKRTRKDCEGVELVDISTMD